MNGNEQVVCAEDGDLICKFLNGSHVFVKYMGVEPEDQKMNIVVLVKFIFWQMFWLKAIPYSMLVEPVQGTQFFHFCDGRICYIDPF